MSAVCKTEAEVPSLSAISRRVESRQAVEGVVVTKEDQTRQHTRSMIKMEETAPAYTPTPRGTAEVSLPQHPSLYNNTGVSNNTGMIIIHEKKEDLERDEDNQWIEFFENCTNTNTNLPDSVSSGTRNRIFMEDSSSMINNNKKRNTLVWGDGTKTSGLLANTSVQQQQQQQQPNVTTKITTVTDGSIIPAWLDGHTNKNKNKNGPDLYDINKITTASKVNNNDNDDLLSSLLTSSLPTTETPAVSLSTEEIISKNELAAKHNNDNTDDDGDGNLKPTAATKEEPTIKNKKQSTGSTSTTTPTNDNTTTTTRTSVGASKDAFTAASRAMEFTPVEASETITATAMIQMTKTSSRRSTSSSSSSFQRSEAGNVSFTSLAQRRLDISSPAFSSGSTNSTTRLRTATSGISSIRSLDVVCGRGQQYRNHHGNQVYRKLIDVAKIQFSKAPKRLAKGLIVSVIINTVQEGGRFIKLVGQGENSTVEMCEDAFIREKVAQSLRDRNRERSGSKVTGRKRGRDYDTNDDDYDNINIHILYDEVEDDDDNDHHGHNGGDDDEDDNENGMSSSLESHLKRKMRPNSCDDNNNISDIHNDIDNDTFPPG